MTKKTILTSFFILVAGLAVAQRLANSWYFGNRGGLDFNTLPPTALTNNNMSALEGCAVICDHEGKVLFYTNGLTVMNRKNTKMLNGDSLLGDLSSTNNALIVPLPGNDSIYYLFTVGAQNQLAKGFRYSIINMNGDSGYGQVVQKNILVESDVYEKLAAVKHCNKKDVWITIRKWSNDEYHSYLVTASGLSAAPVISHSSFRPTNPIGTLKFSSSGRKLAAVYSFETNQVELMDFDNTTGLLSGSVVFQPQAATTTDAFYIEAYGAEFSPSGQFLYISSNNSDIENFALYQFDITSNNSATILASKQLITNTPPFVAGGLQVGPDQKIYVSLFKDNSISVIDNPDIAGTGCNFNYHKIFIGQSSNTPLQFGLPNFIQSYFDPASNYDFTRTGSCTDHDVQFNINNTTGIDSVKWDFGDGQQSRSLMPVNHYISAGLYPVSLVVYKQDCSGAYDTITHKIWVAESSSFLGADTGSCGKPSLQIGIADITDAEYLWNTGASVNSIVADTFATYWLRVEQNGCMVTDSIRIFQLPSPVVKITGDSVVCLNQAVVLNAASSLATSYLWNTGQTTPSITVNKVGLYRVSVTGNSCNVEDSISVRWGDCEAFVPTAFTPNNDGLNDRFGVASGFNAIDFSLKVFDRYGHIIFITADNSQKWDGTFKGKPMPGGAYTWIMSYTNSRGYRYFYQGSVLLIR